jgi:hypothetical protein
VSSLPSSPFTVAGAVSDFRRLPSSANFEDDEISESALAVIVVPDGVTIRERTSLKAAQRRGCQAHAM